MRSSVTMECINTWTSSVKANSLPSPHQTPPGMQFDQTQQMGYYNLQQKNFAEQPVRPINPPTFFQPVSGSLNLQSNHTQLACSSGIRGHSSSASATHSPSNNILRASSQVGSPTVNLSYYPQAALNTFVQSNHTDLHSLQNATSGSFLPASSNEIRCCPSGSISVWRDLVSNRLQTTCQPVTQSQQAAWTAQISHATSTINICQGQRAGQHNETFRFVADVPAASHTPVFMKLCSNISQSQVQRASCQPSSQNHSNKRLNGTLPILTPYKIQSQTTPFLGHHSRTNASTISAIPSSTQNTARGLAANSLDITSLSTSTSHPTCLSGYTTNVQKQKLLALLLQQKSNQQLTGVTPCYSSFSFGSQSAKSKSGYQQMTHDHTGRMTTGNHYKQGMARQGKAKKAGISTRNEIGNHSSGPQKSSQNEMIHWKKRNLKLQSYTDSSDSLKLRMVQVNKIAVVSPISQQASSHGQQNDVSTRTHDSLFSKTDTVKKRFQDCESMDKQTNIPKVTLKVTEDLPHAPPSPGSSPRPGQIIDSSANISDVCTSTNVPTSGFQSCDQCKTDPVSTIQISNKCQNAFCVGSISKSPVEKNGVQEDEFSSEKTTFDLSTVPVVYYTLKELKDLVSSLEVKSTEEDTSAIRNVSKCIMDLYYDGNKQNVLKLLPLKEVWESLPRFCIRKMNDVVFQYVAPGYLLENRSQILKNETTLPSEVFRSSWLNVDGQPADVGNALGDPSSDHNLTWSKKVDQSVSDSVVNVVDNLGQTGTDGAKDLGEQAHQEIPKVTADGISKDIFHSDHEQPTASLATSDCKANMKILDKGCASRTTKEPTRMQGKLTERLNDEVDQVKEDTQAFNEPSLRVSSNERVTSNSDVFDMTDISNDKDSTNDLPDIVLLSSEEAGKIFSDCFGCDQKTEPHQLCQKEKKGLVTHCVKNQSNSVKMKPFVDLKFTCPHVKSLGCSIDFFCPSCWNETPLLDIDQDETVLTPKDQELNTDHWEQSCSPQLSKPTEFPSAPACLENSSIIKSNTFSPKSEGSDAVRNPKLCDQTQSSSPPPAQEPHHGIASNKNSSITKPVAEDLQKNLPSAETEAKHLNWEVADSPPGSQIITEMVSQSRNLSSDSEAVPETNNSPDLIITKTSTCKQHPSDHRSLPTDDHQCTVESKGSYKVPIRGTCLNHLSSETDPGTPSQTPNINGIVPETQNKTIIEEKGQIGQSQEVKQARLQLYGSNSGIHDGKKSIYLTISASPITGKRYVDKPSAKQKIYRKWSPTFIRPQNNRFTYMKHRKKTMEDQLKLKLKIQTLKLDLRDKLQFNLQKQPTENLKLKRAKEDADSSQESKKLKPQ